MDGDGDNLPVPGLYRVFRFGMDGLRQMLADRLDRELAEHMATVLNRQFPWKFVAEPCDPAEFGGQAPPSPTRPELFSN